ncbi:MAG: hypothetical protein EXS50_00425 [Candidatus Taylorbacteria bacterium]|nr:hypothetical protein [Candidatus Taylorbacteria bacterium]
MKTIVLRQSDVRVFVRQITGQSTLIQSGKLLPPDVPITIADTRTMLYRGNETSFFPIHEIDGLTRTDEFIIVTDLEEA